MRKLLFIGLVSLITACKQIPKKKTTSAEAAAPQKEWVDLFNGDSFDGWHQFNSSEMSAAWIIEDGAMVLPDGTGSGKGKQPVCLKDALAYELLNDGSLHHTDIAKMKECIVFREIKGDQGQRIGENDAIREHLQSKQDRKIEKEETSASCHKP